MNIYAYQHITLLLVTDNLHNFVYKSLLNSFLTDRWHLQNVTHLVFVQLTFDILRREYRSSRAKKKRKIRFDIEEFEGALIELGESLSAR